MQTRDWWYVRALCYPELALKPWGEELYKSYVAIGAATADAWLRGEPCAPHDEKMLRAAHHVVFHKVYPFAGQFRGPKDVLVGERERGASSPREIPADIRTLNWEAKRIVAKATTPDEIRQFITGYHARLEEIQPFLDGNKRVALLLSAEHVRSLLQQEFKLALNWEHYREGLKAAREGNLSPLSYALTGEPLHGEELIRTPFSTWLTMDNGLDLDL